MKTKKSFLIMLLAWLMPVIALAEDCTITFSQEGGYVNIDGNPNGISFNIGGGSSGYIIQNPRTFTCSSGLSFTLNIPANSSYVPSRLTINDTEITLVPEVGSSTSVSFTVPEENNVEVKLYWASIITTNYTLGNYSYSVLYNDASASPARRAVLKSYNGSDATVTSTANVTYSSNSYTVVAIAPSAFENNTSITAFTLPTTLRALGSNVFKGCTNLTTVSFNTSTSLEAIPYGAFDGCIKLNRTASGTADIFKIPSSVTSVEANAFNGCTSLKTVQFFTPMESIAYNAFNNCSNDLLFQIRKTGSNSTINSCVFGKNTYCSSVHKLELMSDITTVSDRAFIYCSNLSEVVMTTDVTSIGTSAFPSALKTVTINKGTSAGMISSNLFKNYTKIENLTIGEGVTTILAYAFQNCTSLTNVSLPSTLTTIAAYAFAGCTNITDLDIPEGVTQIFNQAFYNYTGVATIPTTITTINTQAFYNCSGIKVKWTTPPAATNLIDSNQFGANKGRNKTLYVPLGSKAAYQAADGWKEFTDIQEYLTDDTMIPIDEAHFPNQNFRVMMQPGWRGIDADNDGYLSADEIAAVTNLDISEYGNFITDLTGIGYFTALQSLQVNGYKYMTSLDLSSNTALQTLEARFCTSLTALDLSHNTELKVIDCQQGAMEALDLSANTKLESVNCLSNNLTSLIMPSTSTTLHYITCYNNQLKGAAMNAFVNSLPNVSYGTIYIIDKTTYSTEGNVVTTAQVQAATAKGWSVQTGAAQPYPGFEAEIITFADANVKAICVDNWDTNGDGELSYEEAAAVTDPEEFKTAFSVDARADIVSFDEFKYFTGLTEIADFTFRYCTSLQTITFPSTITSIGWLAFGDCAALTNLVLPEGLTTIESSAFKSYTGIVTLPTTITSIDTGAFENAAGAKVSWTTPPDGKNLVGNNQFSRGFNSEKKDLYVPIGTYDAYDVVYWWSFNIKEYGIIEFQDPNVKAICVNKWDTDGDGELSAEEAAAANWWEFATDNDAFRNNTTITSFDELEYFIGLPFIPEGVFISCSNLTSIKLPRTITEIKAWSFAHCANLTSINIPESVTSIDQAAFSNCSNLSELTLPYGITTIGSSAFCNTALQRLDIPYSVTSMDDAFIGTTGNIPLYVSAPWDEPIDITENTFPNRAQATLFVPIGKEEVYRQAPYWQDFGSIVAKIEFNDPAVKAICVAHWDTNGDGELSTAEAAAVTDLGDAFKGNTEIAYFNELNYFTGLTEIVGHAFSDCSALQYINLPENITIIYNAAFQNCTSLYSISIPNGVTLINDYAFAGCTGLTSIALPSSLGMISANMCDGCTSLRGITIPEGVHYYGDEAFANCTNLTRVTVMRSEPVVIDTEYDDPFPTRTSITLIVPAHAGDAYSTAPYWEEFAPITEAEPEWTGIYTDENGDQYQYEVGYSAQLYRYKDNSSRTSFTIPSGITVDGISYPVTAIYRLGSAYLETLTIPASITTLKDEAFSCLPVEGTGFTLKDIYMRGSEPPTVGFYQSWIHEIKAFNTLMEHQYPDDPSKKVSLKDITLHVPTGSLAAYQAADFWKEFTVVEYDWTGTPDEPFTVAQARALVNTSNPDTSDKVYVKGVVSKRNSSPNSNGTLTYWISDDGSQTDELNVYAGYNIDDTAFTGDDLDVGDIVVVYGNIRLRSNTYICGSESTLISRIKHGDVNGDGLVSTADLASLVNIILGKTTSYDFAVADINGDHHVTIADVTTLVNMILGR